MSPATETIEVHHALGRYPVEIGVGGIERLSEFVERLAPGRRVAVITDRNVARVVEHSLKAPVLVVPAGEASKSRRRWADLTDRLFDLGFGRHSVLVAVGGGVVGDLAGFVAATFARGIPVIQVPTSLLAMVDASVGGKTGLNTRHGKNLVGAFHPPSGVLIDPGVLRTLRSAHLRGGLIEAIKHGLVADADYFDWIDRESAALLARDPERLKTLVARSVRIKAGIVSADEREHGLRVVLNAGHTVGHALERWSRFRLPHGDAVGLGLIVEAVVGEHLGGDPGLAGNLAARLVRIGLRATLPGPEHDEALLDLMRHDKKALAGEIRMALPGAPGRLAAQHDQWTTTASRDIVRRALGSSRGLLAESGFHTPPPPV